jgi:hypothetical protein
MQRLFACTAQPFSDAEASNIFYVCGKRYLLTDGSGPPNSKTPEELWTPIHRASVEQFVV